ncbi:hypothetical protein LguiB_013373 [Lonicera macranthoides]
MLKFASWNIRGLNAPHKCKEIGKVIEEFRLNMLCLVENKVNFQNIEKIKRKCLPRWNLIHNCPANGVGRVWFTWDDCRLDMDLLWSSTQTITCRVVDRVVQKIFMATCVYGFNDRVSRYTLWQDLEYIARLVAGHPWVCMGDFNVIHFAHERLGGIHLDIAEMADFNNCLNDIEVVEMTTRDFVLPDIPPHQQVVPPPPPPEVVPFKEPHRDSPDTMQPQELGGYSPVQHQEPGGYSPETSLGASLHENSSDSSQPPSYASPSHQDSSTEAKEEEEEEEGEEEGGLILEEDIVTEEDGLILKEDVIDLIFWNLLLSSPHARHLPPA